MGRQLAADGFGDDREALHLNNNILLGSGTLNLLQKHSAEPL